MKVNDEQVPEAAVPPEWPMQTRVNLKRLGEYLVLPREENRPAYSTDGRSMAEAEALASYQILWLSCARMACKTSLEIESRAYQGR